MRDNALLQVRVAGTGSFNFELDLATAFHKAQQEGGFVDSLPNSDDAMVDEQGGLALGTKCLCNLPTLLLSSNDAGVFRIHSKYPIEVTDVLSDHFERLAKGAPSAAGDGVGVTDGVDVVARIVDFGVNIVPRVVDRASLKMSNNSALCLYLANGCRGTYPVTANNLAIADPQADHVTGVEESKMPANGVHPDQTRELWIAD